MAENNFVEVLPVSQFPDSKVWNFETDGSNFCGYLLKAEHNKGAMKNSNLYSFQSKEDKSLVKVWGSKVLDERMGEIKNGVIVKIEWLGKKVTADGTGRTYHTFKVYSDPSDTIAEGVEEEL